MHGLLKAIAIIAYMFIGGPMVLFLVYAVNGGAGGSSALNVIGWVALIGLGSLFLWGLVGLAMLGGEKTSASRHG